MSQTASKRRHKTADTTPTRGIAAMAQELDKVERRAVSAAAAAASRAKISPAPAKASPAAVVIVAPPPSCCLVCDKPVFLVEQIEVDGTKFHKACFVCTVCRKLQSASSYVAVNRVVYCKPHYKQQCQASVRAFG